MLQTAADKKQKRLKILEAGEIEAVYGLPVFDDEDRAFCFALSPSERAILSQLHGPKSSIYYILQLGYFKTLRQFFVFNTKVTRLKHQGFILELLQCRVCGEEERRQMRMKAQQLAQISSRPIYVFRELMAYLTRQRLIAPGYSVMQEMIVMCCSEKRKGSLT